jgi:hypothetical protein
MSERLAIAKFPDRVHHRDRCKVKMATQAFWTKPCRQFRHVEDKVLISLSSGRG